MGWCRKKLPEVGRSLVEAPSTAFLTPFPFSFPSLQHHFGLVLDGFPRTRVQVECVRQLHQKMLELHKTHRHTDLSQHFPRPKFHMVMLYIEEEVKKTGAWQ